MKSLIPFTTIALFLFFIGKCTHRIYIGFRDFPDYASVEVMTEKYQPLIDDIDSQIDAGSSTLSIGANLESIAYPENTVYVAMVDNDSEHIFVKGSEGGSRSLIIQDGFGYGTLDGVDMVIITRPINKAELKDVIVYIKHLKPDNE